MQKSSPGKVGQGFLFASCWWLDWRTRARQLAHDLCKCWPCFQLLALHPAGVALLIALGFEFVNGFHDTANAVATVIYTHSLEPHVAVVWSGMWNLIGVLTSIGAVAFAIVSLLPVELILQVGQGAGFAMVFALADLGDPVEPGHLVSWAAGIEFAYAHRIDHRRRRGEPVDVRAHRHQRAWTGRRRRMSSRRC